MFPYKKDLFFGGNQEIQFIVFSMLLTVCFKFNFAPVSTLQLVEVLVYAIYPGSTIYIFFHLVTLTKHLINMLLRISYS